MSLEQPEVEKNTVERFHPENETIKNAFRAEPTREEILRMRKAEHAFVDAKLTIPVTEKELAELDEKEPDDFMKGQD